MVWVYSPRGSRQRRGLAGEGIDAMGQIATSSGPRPISPSLRHGAHQKKLAPSAWEGVDGVGALVLGRAEYQGFLSAICIFCHKRTLSRRKFTIYRTRALIYYVRATEKKTEQFGTTFYTPRVPLTDMSMQCDPSPSCTNHPSHKPYIQIRTHIHTRTDTDTSTQPQSHRQYHRF